MAKRRKRRKRPNKPQPKPARETRKPLNRPKIIRTTIFALSVLATLLSIPSVFAAVHEFQFDPAAHAKPFQYASPQIAFICENTLETAFSLLQLSTIMMGATWALIAIENDILEEWQERATFVLGTICLGFSCYSYLLFHDDMITIIQESAIHGDVPDMRHGEVLEYYYSQIVGIVAGAMSIALSILSAKWIKREGTS